MYFSKIAVIVSLAASAFAAPTSGAQKQKRALTFQTYNDFQISSGTGGTALAEAQAAFPVSPWFKCPLSRFLDTNKR